MQILNFGLPEILLILIIAFLILGPTGVKDTGEKLGRLLRKLRKSQYFKDLLNTSNEIRGLPQKILREADLDDTVEILNEVTEIVNNDQELSQRQILNSQDQDSSLIQNFSKDNQS